MNDSRPTDTLEDPPPVGGTWPRLYAAVIFSLLLVIAGLWLFSRAFS